MMAPQHPSYSNDWKVNSSEASPWNSAPSSSLSTASAGSASSQSCYHADDAWSDDLSTTSGSCHWMVLGVGSFSVGQDSKVFATPTPRPSNQQAPQAKRHWMLSAPAQTASTERRASLTSQAKPFVPKAHWMVHGAPFVPQEVAPVPENTPVGIPEAQTQKQWEWSTAAEDFFNTAIAVVTGSTTSTCTTSADEKGTSEEGSSDLSDVVQEEQNDPLVTSVQSLQIPLSVKHTFIHYRDEDSPRQPGMVRSNSAPTLLVSVPTVADTTKNLALQETIKDMHQRGECKPCAYFHQKEDGCRWGVDCEFCHVCLPGEIKKRKREKVRAMKASKTLASRSTKPGFGKP